MKIIVYAGSFNPVTKGHLLVMKSAIESVGADKGMFIITSDKYLKRKMLFKTKTPSSFILSDQTRQEMIETLTLEDNSICFGGREVGSANPSTVKTLKSIIRKNKGSEVYCLMGADKLHNLPKWDEIDTIINDVKIIVAVRSGFEIEKEIENNTWLLEHKDRIIVVNPDPMAFTISSSEVRKRFFANEDYSELMNLGPYNILQKFNPADFPVITNEDLIEYNLKYGGRFGPNKARLLVYEFNKEVFDKWDETLLGSKEQLLNNTKVYKNEFKIDMNNGFDTLTDCVNKDCADVALELIKDGYNPVILNLASNISPGGGYHKGTNAQEECLCQMSTLSQSLYQFGSTEYLHIRSSSVPHKEDAYPLDINYGGIYSPNVTFFRHNKDNSYMLRDEVFSCSIITVASLSNRQKNNYTNDERIYFNPDGTLTEAGRIIESNKIRTIFRIALENGHNAIVLGAFGCGVYNLLPSEVANLFYDILNEPEFNGNFKKVVFAILEGKAKRGSVVGKDGKFKPFYDLF